MKTKRIAALILLVITLVAFSSCDMINQFLEERYRPIPIIETYNSSLTKTRLMVPNDTLYVRASGLEEGKMYTVEVLDPDKKIISMMTTEAILDDELGYGVIDPSPLWYDIGYEVDDETGALTLSDYALDVKSFYIRVYDEEQETDLELQFWFVATNTDEGRPKPILTSGKLINTDIFSMENAFFSKAAADVTDQNDLYPPDGVPANEREQLKDKLYIQVDNLTPLTGKDETENVRVYIIPFTGENIGDYAVDKKYNLHDISYFYFERPIEDFFNLNGDPQPMLVEWPEWGGSTPTEQPEAMRVNMDVDPDSNSNLVRSQTIPIWAEGKSFSIFLDMMDNGPASAGQYNEKQEGSTAYYLDAIDGNGVAGFIVKQTPESSTDYTYEIQLASGGQYSWNYTTRTYDYDYRDEFIANGNDTKYSSHSGPYWGKGIKVIWNPYRTSSGWSAQGVATADVPTGYEISSLWGSIVDVYIIEASVSLTGANLPDVAYLEKRTLPVQYGCSNGWWQQTIWRAPMDIGDYIIVVDVNRNGTFDDDVDLIDNVREDAGAGGFSVVAAN